MFYTRLGVWEQQEHNMKRVHWTQAVFKNIFVYIYYWFVIIFFSSFYLHFNKVQRVKKHKHSAEQTGCRPNILIIQMTLFINSLGNNFTMLTVSKLFGHLTFRFFQTFFFSGKALIADFLFWLWI